MKCIKHQFTWVSGTPHNCLPLGGFCKIPNWKLISDPFERQSKYDVTLVSRPPRIQTLAIHLSFYHCFFPQPLWRISMPLFDCQTVSGQSAHCLRTQSFIKIFIELSVAQIGWSQKKLAPNLHFYGGKHVPVMPSQKFVDAKIVGRELRTKSPKNQRGAHKGENHSSQYFAV